MWLNETQLFLSDWILYRKTCWHSFGVNGSHEVEAIEKKDDFSLKNIFIIEKDKNPIKRGVSWH